MYDNFNCFSVVFGNRKLVIIEGEPTREIHSEGFQPWVGPCCKELYVEPAPILHVRAVFDDGSEKLIFDIDEIESYRKETEDETK